jgi:hypothetical protein
VTPWALVFLLAGLLVIVVLFAAVEHRMRLQSDAAAEQLARRLEET